MPKDKKSKARKVAKKIAIGTVEFGAALFSFPSLFDKTTKPKIRKKK